MKKKLFILSSLTLGVLALCSGAALANEDLTCLYQGQPKPLALALLMVKVDSPNPRRVLLSTTTSVDPEARLKDEFLGMNCYEPKNQSVNHGADDEQAYCIEQDLENKYRETGYSIRFDKRKLSNASAAVIYWHQGGELKPMAVLSCKKTNLLRQEDL